MKSGRSAFWKLSVTRAGRYSPDSTYTGMRVRMHNLEVASASWPGGACSVALPCSSSSAFSLLLNPLELKLDLDRWDCSRRSACQQVFTEFRQRQQLGRAVAWEMLRSNTVQSVHGMLQQKRSMAAPCAGLSCTEKTRQHSSARPSTPSSHVAVAPGSAANDLPQSRPSPACGSGAGTPSVACPLALVKSTWKLRGHAPPCGMLTQRRSTCGRHLRRRP